MEPLREGQAALSATGGAEFRVDIAANGGSATVFTAGTIAGDGTATWVAASNTGFNSVGGDVDTDGTCNGQANFIEVEVPVAALFNTCDPNPCGAIELTTVLSNSGNSASSNDCQSDGINIVIDVNNPPVADFTVTNLCQRPNGTFQTATLDASATMDENLVDGDTLDYMWSSDMPGTFSNPSGTDATSVATITTDYTPSAVGVHTITLEVTDSYGCMDETDNSATYQITVTSNQLAPCNTLPVEFVSFDGRMVNGSSAELTWVTATELENDRFEIERKVDNLQDWEKVGSVSGAGTTQLSQTYSYVDDLPASAHLIYYRLKQIDYDGSFEYSDIIILRNKVKKDNITVVSNPSGMLTVSIGVEENRTVQGIQLFNTLGQRVANVNLDQSLSGSIFHQEIETQGLSTGTYFIQIIFNDGSMASKAVRF